MFPKFNVFENSESVLLAQLSMLNAKDAEPSPPPHKATGPVSELADRIEAVLASGQAATCSEALAIIARTSPQVIDKAADFREALQSPVTRTAEQNYRQAILAAKQQHNLSSEAAQQLINKSRPDLREAFVAEHNERHAGSMVGKPLTASRAYWNAVQTAQREKQLTQPDAMRYVNAHHADLREAMVKEVNS